LTYELNNVIRILDAELPKNKIDDTINLNSPAQLSYALYDVLNFPVVDRSRRTGAPSTATATLEKLQSTNESPIFDAIFKYRAYTTGIANITGYIKLAGENRVLHPNINTNIARTGRQSISNPALQVVSKENSSGVKYPIPARRCFRPTPGAVLLAPDYSGIELWLIIEIAKEKELIQTLLDNPTFNVHSHCCDIFTGSRDWRTTSKEKRYMIRDGMKTYDFGKPYGGKFEVVTAGLSQFYNLQSRRDGDKRFAKEFPGIYNFANDQKHFAEEHGYIRTIFGRKLYIDSGKEYISANYIVQGTAAQILKIAQVNLNRYFERVWNNEVKLIFPVHDELVMHCPRIIWNNLNDRHMLYTSVNNIMTYIPEIQIKLTTEWKIIKTNWANGVGYEA